MNTTEEVTKEYYVRADEFGRERYSNQWSWGIQSYVIDIMAIDIVQLRSENLILRNLISEEIESTKARTVQLKAMSDKMQVI